MSLVIQLFDWGCDSCASAFNGQYLVEYDPFREGISPDGFAMTAHLVTTPDKVQALRFESASEAFDYSMRSNGVRMDGKPNRPLTAFSLQFSEVDNG
jgi:hypothetical protein